jgi:hypothetical protein
MVMVIILRLSTHHLKTHPGQTQKQGYSLLMNNLTNREKRERWLSSMMTEESPDITEKLMLLFSHPFLQFVKKQPVDQHQRY